jgi:hypothetical protein
MRRTVAAISITMALAATGVVLTAAPAAADFHAACANGAGSASTDLQEAFAGLQYTGEVNCDGATISIDVTLSSLGKGTISETSTSCAASTDPCVASETAAPAPGHYTVEMTFTASGNGYTLTTSRVSEWYYSGFGQPVNTCPVFGFPRPFDGCI